MNCVFHVINKVSSLSETYNKPLFLYSFFKISKWCPWVINIILMYESCDENVRITSVEE